MADETYSTDCGGIGPNDVEREFSSLDIEPDVIRELALAADAIQIAARRTKWGFVSDHCANALIEIKKAIVQACGRIE